MSTDESKTIFKLTFPQSRWGQISEEAKQLIASLLQVDPHKRLSIREALLHCWVAPGKKIISPARKARIEFDSPVNNPPRALPRPANLTMAQSHIAAQSRFSSDTNLVGNYDHQNFIDLSLKTQNETDSEGSYSTDVSKEWVSCSLMNASPVFGHVGKVVPTDAPTMAGDTEEFNFHTSRSRQRERSSTIGAAAQKSRSCSKNSSMNNTNDSELNNSISSTVEEPVFLKMSALSMMIQNKPSESRREGSTSPSCSTEEKMESKLEYDCKVDTTIKLENKLSVDTAELGSEQHSSQISNTSSITSGVTSSHSLDSFGSTNRVSPLLKTNFDWAACFDPVRFAKEVPEYVGKNSKVSINIMNLSIITLTLN